MRGEGREERKERREERKGYDTIRKDKKKGKEPELVDAQYIYIPFLLSRFFLPD